MKTVYTGIFVLISMVLLSTSCVIAVLDYPDWDSRYKAEEFHRVLPLEEEGELSLNNTHGIIEITGWDSDEIEISAEKMLPRPYGRRIRIYNRRDFLPRIDVERYDNIVKIRTDDRGGMEYVPEVNYYLSVPRHIHLDSIRQDSGEVLITSLYGTADIDLGEGHVTVENFSGSLTVAVRDGGVDLSLFDLRAEDDIRIDVESGSISIALEEDVSATIIAESPQGEILNDFRGEEERDSGRLSLKVGEGGARIDLKTRDGEIRITKMIDQ